nr:MAG TPA: hypothetical protein [Bacteriophage sp.]
MDSELYHHGIRGMRWGIRRYQNKDGSLTPAGKKRYDKEMSKLKAEEKVLKNKQKTQAKLDKLETKRKEVEALRKGKPIQKESSEPKKKTISDLSDDELRRVVNRMQLEQQYRNLNPAKVTKGKKIADKVVNQVVVPAAMEVGKQAIKQALSKAVKVEPPKDNKNKK